MPDAPEDHDLAAAAISRVLRLPLTSAVGLGLAARGAPRRDDLATAQADAVVLARSQRVERALLDLVEIDRLVRSGEPGPQVEVDLAEVAREAVASLETGRNIDVEVPPMRWRGDPRIVVRILTHLLHNAVDHSDDTVRVWLRGATSTDGHQLVVEDEGPGVPAALQGSLFEPFTRGPDTATTPGPRLGLGLTIAAQYAATQDGVVAHEPREPGGARFVLTLPA